MGYNPPMIFEHDNTAGFLKATLEEKARQNSRYSLRAFAKKIGLSPGGLSQVMNGKKGLSPERAHSIGQALELTEPEVDYLLALVQMESARAPALRLQYLSKLKELNPKLVEGPEFQQSLLDLENFKLISDWYGLAVLELVTVVREDWTPAAIAKRLGISKIEAATTLDRLLKLDLIQSSPSGSYRRVKGSMVVRPSVPDEAIRKYYSGVHDRSLESLSQDERASGAQVFAFDPDQLEEVKEMVDDFLLRLNKLAMKGKRRSEVYQALANVFPLTR